MKEYIAEVIQSEYGEAVVIKKELIRCKDCANHYGRTRCAIHLGLWFEDNYCDSSKRKEE